MLSLDEDVMTIEHLDWDHEIPCEQFADCDKAAEWKFTVSCCGVMLFFCDPCFKEMKEASKRSDLTHLPCGNNAKVLNPERFKVSA